jgi:pimeloyl-ACP methyl ester carboxylesterase
MKSTFCLALLLLCHTLQGQPKIKRSIVEGKGPIVVLLHGGTFDYNAFAPHAKLLADSFTVIRMQQFNVQYADEGRVLPESYSIRMESEAIKTTLDSLKMDRPILLVGHSYGGVVAFDFAMNHPEKLSGLVLVEAPLFHIARLKDEYSDQMKEIEELTGNFTPDQSITEDMIRSFRCKMANCDSIDIRKHPMWPRWLKQKDRLRGLSMVANYKVDLNILRGFRKPVLIITGTKTISANKIIDRLLATEFKNARTTVLPGDHIAIYQNPQIFVKQLKKFHREIAVK